MMDKANEVNNSFISSSKLLNLFTIGIISFLMVFKNDALLFNPFILSSVWFSYRLSPFKRNTFLITLIGFSFIFNINFGIEILLVSLFVGLLFLCNKFINTSIEYQEFLPLLICLIIISIRYLSFNVLLPSIFNCLINVIFTLLIAYSLEKVRFSKENPGESLNFINKIIVISIIFSLFFNIDIFNLFLIALMVLFLIKNDKQEIVLGELLLLFLYNYLFFSIPIEILTIYLVGLTFASFSKRFAPIIFVILVDGFYIVKYKDFYLDLNFYLNILLTLIYYYFPKSLENKIKSMLFSNEDYVYTLEEKLSRSNLNLEVAKEYLSLIKEDPIMENDIESQILLNVDKSFCEACQNINSCSLRSNFPTYLKQSINKSEKMNILNNCYYPYKLIAKFERANKNYYYQLACKENKILNRELFNRQIDIILSSLDTKIEENENIENNFYLDYEVITSSLDKENGDSYYLIDDKNKFLVLLSDGMGHSKEAHQISQYLISLFINSYKLSKNNEKTLKNINLLLKTKSTNESFATLDLASFNLVDGKVTLYKQGAFVSFLIRNGKVQMFNKISLPLGIIDSVEIFKEEIEIKENDYFIFLSDGFGDEVEERINKTLDIINLYTLDEYINALYKELNENNNQDDKTLLVFKVSLI